MLELVIDNDVLIKMSRFQLVGELLHLACPAGCANNTGVLATARFICAARLRKAITNGETTTNSVETFEAFLASVEILEPSEKELALAAQLEDEAQAGNLALDAGESILTAIATLRGSQILTGDKRAVAAIEQLLATVPDIRDLSGCAICLEQAVMTLTDSLGADVVRARICAEPTADHALRLVFECRRDGAEGDFEPLGLISYIDDLRRFAPTVLMPGYRLQQAA